MTPQTDIYTAAGIIIRDRKLLVECSYNKSHFIVPGGSIEPGETPKQALVRELMEECSIIVKESDLQPYGVYQAEAARQPGKTVTMHVFMVTAWQGEPVPSAEVKELRWITSKNEENLPLGSIFEHQVTPQLVAANLMD